jgi:hypothetical protein
MAEATTKIATVTGAGNPQTISFTSIPQTYDDLLVMGQCADTSTAAGLLYLDVTWGVAGTNYSWGYAYTTNSGSSGYSANAEATEARIAMPGSTNSEDAVGSFYMYLPRYATTSYRKQAWYENGCILNATNQNSSQSNWMANIILNATSAVSSIELKMLFGTHKTNNKFTLYGISNS